uniref:G-protein coupled receptor tkr-1 n=1 Tax=Ascaris suum TaxID=6253 RepID=F1L5K6_ASCSU
MVGNFTLRAIEKQYNNETVLTMIADYACSNMKTATPLPDLHCQEFPVKHSIPTQIVVATAFSILILTAVIGNCVVMWIIATHKVMHRGFNYFLFNIAFADFLIALLNVGTTWTFNFYYDWWYGDFCAVNLFFGVAPTCVSVFTMMAVSWDRCHAVVNPLRKRPLSNHRIVWIIAAIWISAVGVALPVAICSRTEKHFFFSDQRHIISVQWLCISDFAYKVVYDNLLLIIQYILPLIFLSVTYGRIAYAFRNQTDDFQQHSTKYTDHLHAKRKAVKMLALVVGIFMVCWLPYQLYHAVLERLITDFEFASYSYMVFYWLAMSASAYNPFIYCYANARFRLGFRYVFRWLPCVNCSIEEYKQSELFPEKVRSYINYRSIRKNIHEKCSTYSIVDYSDRVSSASSIITAYGVSQIRCNKNSSISEIARLRGLESVKKATLNQSLGNGLTSARYCDCTPSMTCEMNAELVDKVA